MEAWIARCMHFDHAWLRAHSWRGSRQAKLPGMPPSRPPSSNSRSLLRLLVRHHSDTHMVHALLPPSRGQSLITAFGNAGTFHPPLTLHPARRGILVAMIGLMHCVWGEE